MARVGIIGCGVVGAAIAYHLSLNPRYEICVWERRSPDEFGATGAALGVLMAAITPKLKGKHVRLRLASLQLYDAWVEALESALDITLPYNREGIVQLLFDQSQFERWEKTVMMRTQQGFALERWPLNQLVENCPRLSQACLMEAGEPCVGAVYSPCDRQINPVALTQACRQAAIKNGTHIHFDTSVQGIELSAPGKVAAVLSDHETWPIDVLVVSAGLGSMVLTEQLSATLPIQPVLGQALKLKLHRPWATRSPTISGEDVHLVPLNPHELWVGATVEFPLAATPFDAIAPNPKLLEQVLQQAIALCPELAAAEVVERWSGLRPRPLDHTAPILHRLPGYENAIAATAHYRNGVLLAPITAHRVAEILAEFV